MSVPLLSLPLLLILLLLLLFDELLTLVLGKLSSPRFKSKVLLVLAAGLAGVGGGRSAALGESCNHRSATQDFFVR